MVPLCHILLALEPCEWSDLVIRSIAFGFSLFEEKKKKTQDSPTLLQYIKPTFLLEIETFPLLKMTSFPKSIHSFIKPVYIERPGSSWLGDLKVKFITCPEDSDKN